MKMMYHPSYNLYKQSSASSVVYSGIIHQLIRFFQNHNHFLSHFLFNQTSSSILIWYQSRLILQIKLTQLHHHFLSILFNQLSLIITTIQFGKHRFVQQSWLMVLKDSLMAIVYVQNATSLNQLKNQVDLELKFYKTRKSRVHHLDKD